MSLLCSIIDRFRRGNVVYLVSRRTGAIRALPLATYRQLPTRRVERYAAFLDERQALAESKRRREMS
ncbi:MAG TPA: hypothetical protein VEA41_09185 [Salinarimonas sp.]|nr:hypothetical protein [Salinarimonas sp.]